MKRLWISVTVLFMLAAFSAWSSHCLTLVCSELVHDLHAADQAVTQGDWEDARQLTEEAAAHWEEKSAYLYMAFPHRYTDDITADFQEVLALLRWQEEGEYASANQRLIIRLTHMGRSEQLIWGNLL